jgi:RluA family pseudouridine synthase
MSTLDVDILYEVGPCLVVNKPPGLLTQAPPGIDSLERRIKTLLKQRENKPGRVYLGVPHRLDRPVSGAIVFGIHARAARRLSEQFESRLVEKVYWAVVEGQVTPEQGTWQDYMRKIPEQPRSEILPPTHPEARDAVLHYRVLATGPWGTWLEIQLETGRMHQIRLQASSRGHPVLGDAMYGSRLPFGVQYEDQRLRAIALHARSLRFEHPMTREPLALVAPLGRDWIELGLPLLS